MDEFTRKPIRFHGFVLDPNRRLLREGDRVVDLRPKAFDVLLYLVERPGRLVDKDEIIRSVWFDVIVTDESLTRCISDVRHAIGDSAQTIIKTVPRRGYLFAAMVTPDAAAYSPVPAPEDAAQAVAPEPAPAPTPDPQPSVPRASPRRAAALIVAVVVLAIAAAAVSWRLHAAGPATPDSPSVAVLPFAESGAGSDGGYLSEGLAEDLTANLSRFRELFVVAHESARTFRNKPFVAEEIGRALGARYLITGSVRRDGSRVRITAHLTDAATAHEIWAESYDRETADYFTIQQEATQQIVAALVAHVVKSETERVLGKPPETLAVYETVLRANALTRGRPNDLAAIAEAKKLYESALAADPRYARALEGLAYTHFLSWAAEKSPDYQKRPVLDRAVALAQQAVDLDGARAEGHATLGWLLNFVDRTEEGVAAFEEAFARNPNFVDGRYGMLLSHVGRAPEAIDYMQRAMRINPFHPPTYIYWLGKGHYFSGHFDQAIGYIRIGVERQPGVLPPRVLLAAVAARLGREEEARSAVAEVLRLRPNFRISNWLKFLRITDPSYVDHLVADLRKAGLPD